MLEIAFHGTAAQAKTSRAKRQVSRTSFAGRLDFALYRSIRVWMAAIHRGARTRRIPLPRLNGNRSLDKKKAPPFGGASVIARYATGGVGGLGALPKRIAAISVVGFRDHSTCTVSNRPPGAIRHKYLVSCARGRAPGELSPAVGHDASCASASPKATL
jgi:hypothetical protein